MGMIACEKGKGVLKYMLYVHFVEKRRSES